MRYAALLCAIATAASAAGPSISISELSTPAAQTSLGAALTTAPDGTVWLSWVESHGSTMAEVEHHHAPPASDGAGNTLKFAILNADGHSWNSTRVIVADKTVPTSSADFPQLAIDGHGVVYALWTDGHGGARLAKSTDHGATWSTSSSWSTGHQGVEKFALQRLNDGRVLVAWLDGRGHKIGGKMQRLYARYVGAADDTDQLIDPAVCDCCQTALAPFLDGGALVAYRGRTEEEIRDIRVARLDGGSWQSPRPLSNDEWKINACPINGPRLATDGSRVAAAWYTAAEGEPRVFVSYSPDAGNRWLMPLRIDRGHPVGHVEVLLLRDGAIVAVWLESGGSLWLRRITPEFGATSPVELAAPGVTAIRGVPRAAIVRDYAGENTSAKVVVAFTRDAAPAGVRTIVATIPEGELINAERNCNCAPTAEQLQGFPMRGTVTNVDATKSIVSVIHAPIPGIFRDGTHDFHVSPEVLTTIRPSHEFLGRIARQADGTWWLFDLRHLGEPAATR